MDTPEDSARSKPDDIRSLGHFIDEAHNCAASCSAPYKGHQVVLWWRGQPDGRDGLLPTLYRPASRVRIREDLAELTPAFERILFDEFRLRAPAHIGDRPRTPLEWLFLMRHAGLPTRLLDWTQSALVALHFALERGAPDYAGAVWSISPMWLNERWHGFGMVAHDDDRLSPYVANLRQDDSAEVPVERPVALYPPYSSPRIAAQLGRFTLHGSDRRGLEEQIGLYAEFGFHLCRIEIPAEVKPLLRMQLSYQAGVSEGELFPDLDGLSRDICDMYGVLR